MISSTRDRIAAAGRRARAATRRTAGLRAAVTAVLHDAEHDNRRGHRRCSRTARGAYAAFAWFDYTAALLRAGQGVPLASICSSGLRRSPSPPDEEQLPMNIRDVMTPNPRTVSPGRQHSERGAHHARPGHRRGAGGRERPPRRPRHRPRHRRARRRRGRPAEPAGARDRQPAASSRRRRTCPRARPRS